MVFLLKSNTKPFNDFTNCNLSQRLVELILLFSMMLSFTAAYGLKSEKDWPVDFAKL